MIGLKKKTLKNQTPI